MNIWIGPLTVRASQHYLIPIFGLFTERGYMGGLHDYNQIRIAEHKVFYIDRFVLFERKPMKVCERPRPSVSGKSVTTVQTAGSGIFSETARIGFGQGASTDIATTNEHEPLVVFRLGT